MHQVFITFVSVFKFLFQHELISIKALKTMNEEYFEVRESENEIAIKNLTEKFTKEEQSI